MLIKSSDMVSTIPDQKVREKEKKLLFYNFCITRHYCFQVTATFLSYLAARLLDLSSEIRAARCIQLAWRKRQAGKRERELKVKYRK